jgi:hypothetical protein
MLKNHHGRKRSLRALMLIPAVLALAGCKDVLSTDSAEALAGTYTGSATTLAGPVTYRLTVPPTSTASFPVSGTVVEDGRTIEVHGTGMYDYPRVAFELVPAGGSVEDVFGISGSVSDSNDVISIPRDDVQLVLRRR